MHSACINPAIVKIEKSASRNREVNRFIVPTSGAKHVHIVSRNSWRILVHFADEPEQRFMLLIETRSLQIAQHAPNQFPITGPFLGEQFRRDRGVALQSKRTLVAVRRKSRDQFAQAGADRRRTAQYFLREPRQMVRCVWKIGEHVPNLRILLARLLLSLDEVQVRGRLAAAFHIGKEHGLHARAALDVVGH